MSYKAPKGTQRLWTYLPEETVRQLRWWAAEHRRSVPEELRVAVEAYLEAVEGERAEEGGEPQ